MPRTFRMVAAVLGAVLVLAATADAASPGPKTLALVGTLKEVEGPVVAVQTPKGVQTVQLVGHSWIHRGAETIAPEDLPSYTGQRIKIRYVERGGGKQAETVTLASGKAEKK